MKPLALWVALTIGGGDVQLDVGGAVAIRAPLHAIHAEFDALTVGPIVFYDLQREYHLDPWVWSSYVLEEPGPDLFAHELVHVRQWEALGPALPLAYGLVAGRGFEDYLGDGSMWEPGPELERRCPVVRWSRVEGLGVMPCWRFGG